MLHILHLRTFVAVVAAQSFTRAAIELGCSQSTVTTRIKSLERELGATLFDRFRFARRFTLTEVGERVHEAATPLLTLAEELKGAVRKEPE